MCVGMGSRMRRIGVVAVGMVLLASCSMFEPPTCRDDGVDAKVRQLLARQAAEILDAKVDLGDPLSLVRLMGLGIGMPSAGRFEVSPQAARAIHWRLANHRTSGINRELGIRACAVDVAYGKETEVIGSFVLGYTVRRTDDGKVYVQLLD